MKKTVLYTILLLIITTSSINAQIFTGSWKGTLIISDTSKLDLIIHIKQHQQQWIGTMDSPNQMAYGIPMQSVTIKGDSITILANKLGLEIRGEIKNSTTLAATFKQSGLIKPINFSRMNDKEITSISNIKPQTPTPPYPYKESEVSFSNRTNGITLYGTLTVPKNNNIKKIPAILLIAGSGPMDRNESILGHKPFAVIADYFTNKGFAVLRYDKRGVGKSEGKLINATSADLLEDAEAALNFLSKQYFVDKDKIGVIGHSEGGMLAIQLATSHKHLDYIVTMAAPTITGKEIIKFQLNRDAPDEMKDKINNTVDYIYNTPIDNINTKHIENLLLVNRATDTSTKPIIQFLTAPWSIHFIKYNPCDDIKRIQIPVYAVNGELDQQVEAKTNINNIKKCLENRGLLTSKIFPNLNHLFQTSNTGHPMEYATIDETIAPTVLEDIYKWIEKTIHK